MSPQEAQRQQELLELAERESQQILGVSWDDAQQKLKRGELRGTAAEAEFRGLLFLMG